MQRCKQILTSVFLLTSLNLATGLAYAEHQESTPDTKSSFRENYTKFEYQIPMRDGVKLYTVVYVPKDDTKKYPFLMNRTPYSSAVYTPEGGRYGVDFMPASGISPAKEMEESGYIFVKQDVRGRYMSEGKWQEMTPHHNPALKAGEGIESQDMYDTVEWLLKNIPGNNGKVGIWGISYPGFYAIASAINGHPAIKAVSPQAPVTNLYMGDDSYHGGAFFLAANFDFYSSFTEQKNPTPGNERAAHFHYDEANGYDYFLKHKSLKQIQQQLSPEQRVLLAPMITHTHYDDFWQSRDISRHLKGIKAAVLTVGGWFDAEDLAGPLNVHRKLVSLNKDINATLVMGPWSHGAWAYAEGRSLGMVNFDGKTSEYYRKKILVAFFDKHLKTENSPAEKKSGDAYVFETGTNIWRHYPSWPPQEVVQRSLYLRANGELSWQQASQVEPSFDDYVSDPAKPVPFVGYPTQGMPREYMVSDQRFAATRPDVLVYQTAVLEHDVTIAGPVQPHLFVSTSATDADWVVKLIDVYPAQYPEPAQKRDRTADVPAPGIMMAGYQQLVRAEPLRGKFRNGFEKSEAFEPGKVEALRYSMPDINHTFRRGHRIMVQIQSSWFPLIDLNPQKFMHIPDAEPTDFQKATQRIYRDQKHPSAIVLPVLSR